MFEGGVPIAIRTNGVKGSCWGQNQLGVDGYSEGLEECVCVSVCFTACVCKSKRMEWYPAELRSEICMVHAFKFVHLCCLRYIL